MKKTAPNSRMNFTLSDDDLKFLDELARQIGCSRSAVVSHLLSHHVEKLRAIPARIRAREIRSFKGLVRGAELIRAGDSIGVPVCDAATEANARKVLRARGPSLGFIQTVLDGLLHFATDEQMSLSL
jgi:Ribbon-helix-helix protein, copG family.